MTDKRILLSTLLVVISIVVHSQSDLRNDIITVLKEQTISRAAWALTQEPATITSTVCPRSAGGKHDFYSEGDYWWPDPTNPGGAYVQRDGQTNPDNFVAHRHAMIRFSQIIGALASAYSITKDKKYANHAFRHARAWFVDGETKMNPSLLYAQAIKGKVTGRGIGIIDTIHLMEVAQGIRVMEGVEGVDKSLVEEIKNWFAQYLQWLTTHQYGKDEMNAENNHGTCWVMQVACFARLTGNNELIQFCRDRYKTVLLPNQMAEDGRFPRELRRTKPYGYSLFNLDAMVMVCHILTDSSDNLWNFKLTDGRGIRKGIEFLFPYVKQKDKWPYSTDVMYWNDWPVAHPFLVMGALIFTNKDWFGTWKISDHNPKVEEVVRNLPVRNPIIWLNDFETITTSKEKR
jgi:hypothetical protein